MTDWKQLHREGYSFPKGMEIPITNLINGFLEYETQLKEELDWKVGDDSYCGPEWIKIGEAIRSLLSGPVGNRLDRGTLDKLLVDAMTRQDYDVSMGEWADSE